MTDKIAMVREMIGEQDIIIEVDGGITVDTAGAVVAAGATALVAGSAIFRGDGTAAYAKNIAAIRQAAASHKVVRGLKIMGLLVTENGLRNGMIPRRAMAICS